MKEIPDCLLGNGKAEDSTEGLSGKSCQSILCPKGYRRRINTGKPNGCRVEHVFDSSNLLRNSAGFLCRENVYLRPPDMQGGGGNGRG